MKLKVGHAICEKHFKPEDILQERLTYASDGVDILGRHKEEGNKHIVYFLN